MKAFEFEHQLVDSYARFSRSFKTIRADDLSTEVERQYDAGRFWPDAMLSLNPRYLSGPTVDDLVASGDLDEATGKIFRFGDSPVRFHRHQAQSIAKARAGQSYVVTTGTGSGKSLRFFVPVVDAIIKARKTNGPRGTCAIIVYPMNALANSQLKEIEKFIGQSGFPENLRPTVKRYTDQESQDERQKIADEPPDILLTNFMMAELLLTRQDELDARLIQNASLDAADDHSVADRDLTGATSTLLQKFRERELNPAELKKMAHQLSRKYRKSPRILLSPDRWEFSADGANDWKDDFVLARRQRTSL